MAPQLTSSGARPQPGPLVSVLTASLNQAAFVGDCLASVRRQDYEPIEHIVVDGDSSDGTLEILRGERREALSVFVEPGSSQSEALNAAFARSSGEIVGWLNTDDAYFGVDAVSTVVEAFGRNPHCVAVYGDAVMIDERGRVLRHVSTSVPTPRRMETLSPLVQPAVFFRREAVADDFLREDLNLVMDYELWLRLQSRGPFRKVNRILAVDRDYAGRKTRSLTAETAEELERLALAYGIPPDDRARPLRAVSRWLRRVSGLGPLLTVERRYRLAFAAELDAGGRRLVRQLALPQRFLHGG